MFPESLYRFQRGSAGVLEPLKGRIQGKQNEEIGKCLTRSKTGLESGSRCYAPGRGRMVIAHGPNRGYRVNDNSSPRDGLDGNCCSRRDQLLGIYLLLSLSCRPVPGAAICPLHVYRRLGPWASFTPPGSRASVLFRNKLPNLPSWTRIDDRAFVALAVDGTDAEEVIVL